MLCAKQRETSQSPLLATARAVATPRILAQSRSSAAELHEDACIVLVEMSQKSWFARFLHSFSNFWFSGPLGSIKHKTFGCQFF